jgi:hypothetical protein
MVENLRKEIKEGKIQEEKYRKKNIGRKIWEEIERKI